MDQLKTFVMLPIKSLLLAAVIFSSTNAWASADNKEPKTFKSTFTSVMKSIDLNDYNIPSDRLYIEFMVNDDQEIIVLSTSSQELDNVIKERANYKKIEQTLTPFEKYTIKVSIDRK